MSGGLHGVTDSVEGLENTGMPRSERSPILVDHLRDVGVGADHHAVSSALEANGHGSGDSRSTSSSSGSIVSYSGGTAARPREQPLTVVQRVIKIARDDPRWRSAFMWVVKAR